MLARAFHRASALGLKQGRDLRVGGQRDHHLLSRIVAGQRGEFLDLDRDVPGLQSSADVAGGKGVLGSGGVVEQADGFAECRGSESAERKQH